MVAKSAPPLRNSTEFGCRISTLKGGFCSNSGNRKKIDKKKKREKKNKTQKQTGRDSSLHAHKQKTILLINRLGISKSRVLVSLMMFCPWQLKLYLLYVWVNYSKF